MAAAGGYISTIWNKTDDLHPWDFGDNYVSHMTWSDEKPAEETARILFEAMGGEGGVVHLGGIAANNPAVERLNGLKNALKDFPNIELLDAQPADWDTQKGAALMSSFLTRYGDRIKGVHCANDNIAYGVIEALRAEGIEGMPIVSYDGNPEAVQMVMDGQLLATVFTNPHWGGGITSALAYHAATGSFKPSEEPKEHREFYGPTVLVSKRMPRSSRPNIWIRYLNTIGPTSGVPRTDRFSIGPDTLSGDGAQLTVPDIPIRDPAKGAHRDPAHSRETLIKWAPLLVLFALVIFFTVLNPTFFSARNFARIAIASAPALMVAVGVTFIIIMGSIDLSMKVSSRLRPCSSPLPS